MVKTILGRLGWGRRPAVWNLPRKQSYQQRKIELAVDDLLELHSLLVAQLGHDAPILRDVRRDLQRVVMDLNHADDLTVVEPQVRSKIDVLTSGVRSINVSGIVFGIVSILSLILSVPWVHQFFFGSNCPVVESSRIETSQTESERALNQTKVNSIKETPAEAEVNAQQQPKEKHVGNGRVQELQPAGKRKAKSDHAVQGLEPTTPTASHESTQVVGEAESVSPPLSIVVQVPEGPPTEHRGTSQLHISNGPSSSSATKREIEILPKIDKKVSPDCPAGIELSKVVVELRVLVGADGHVQQIEKRGSGPVSAIREATRAARRSIFRPGTRGGIPLEMWVPVRYDFSSCN